MHILSYGKNKIKNNSVKYIIYQKYHYYIKFNYFIFVLIFFFVKNK